MQQRSHLISYIKIDISVYFKCQIQISQQTLDTKNHCSADVSMPYSMLQSDVKNKQRYGKPLHRLEAWGLRRLLAPYVTKKYYNVPENDSA